MSHSPHVGRKILSVAAIVVAASLLAACSGEPEADAPSPIGIWGSEATEQPNLSFTADAVSGTDGCNRLSGSWSQDDSGRIHFEQVVSTQMYCEWVNTWLAELDSALILDDEMHVFNANGVEIGTLAKN